METIRHRNDEDWMMEVIASDELYAVADFDEENIIAGGAAASGTGNAGDMARFLSSETGPTSCVFSTRG